MSNSVYITGHTYTGDNGGLFDKLWRQEHRDGTINNKLIFLKAQIAFCSMEIKISYQLFRRCPLPAWLELDLMIF